VGYIVIWEMSFRAFSCPIILLLLTFASQWETVRRRGHDRYAHMYRPGGANK